MRRIVGIFMMCAMFALCAFPAFARNAEKAPPGPPYKKVSELMKLPDFISGIGTLYVDPKTLPESPFLAYHHRGRLVGTIYVIPLKDLDAQKNWSNLKDPGGRVDYVSIDYNVTHPGVPEPHYHIVLGRSEGRRETRTAHSASAARGLMSRGFLRRDVLEALTIVAASASAGLERLIVAEAESSEAQKISHADAKYQPIPNGRQRCEICIQFEPPDHCKIVRAPISANG